MFDLELLRDDRNAVAAALSKRLSPDETERALTSILALAAERRSLVGRLDEARRVRKELAREYAAAKREGRVPPTEAGANKALVAQLEEALAAAEATLADEVAALPNMPAEDVVAGGKENNRVLRVWGAPPELANLVDHTTVARTHDLVDFERGAKLGGAGYWIYSNIGARLEWALINWFIEEHIANGYEFMLPPHLLLESAGFAAGQFPKFRDDVYEIRNTDSDRPQFLLPTAETAIIGMYQNDVFTEADLPHKVFAYTPCYRRERAGSHSDERGTVRGHQFNKVEIFQFVRPEGAAQALDEMVEHAERLVRGLGLHHRVSLLAAGDTSASMRRTLDIEVWMPHTGAYKEVSSVSWAGDYQARRANVRYRGEHGNAHVHTLNGSALATSRLMPAILEQCQQPDGSVLVPEVLRDRVGVEVIKAVR